MVGDQVISNVAVPLSLMRSSTAFRGVVMDDCLFGVFKFVMDKSWVCRRPQPMPLCLRVVMPRLTEAHVYLDKCFTISRMTSAVDSFAAALTAQSEDKVNWTHGDAAHQAPFTWEAIGEITKTYKSDIDLQLCALISTNDMVDYKRAKTITARVAQSRLKIRFAWPRNLG